MAEYVFTTRTDVLSVLDSPDFEPPPPGPGVIGELAELRGQMARFSSDRDHPTRRAAIDDAIAALEGVAIAADAERRTTDALTGAGIDALAELGFVVPTHTLANALGCDDDELESVRRDVHAVTEVIGRQQPTTTTARQAVDRLRQRFGSHPIGALPAISLLYQNHDATAALLAASISADHDDGQRRCALARTVRTATRPTRVNQTAVPAGATVAVDLEASGLEFGAGPHQCPGRLIAEQIVRGITAGLAAHDYRLDVSEVGWKADGRPMYLPMKPGIR